MKKILLASLLVLTVLSVDVMAKGGKGKGNKPEGTTERKEKGERKGPTFTDGCLAVDENAKGPIIKDAEEKADTDGDGCITEEEFKAYMKNNKPEGGRGHGPRGEKAE